MPPWRAGSDVSSRNSLPGVTDAFKSRTTRRSPITVACVCCIGPKIPQEPENRTIRNKRSLAPATPLAYSEQINTEDLSVKLSQAVAAVPRQPRRGAGARHPGRCQKDQQNDFGSPASIGHYLDQRFLPLHLQFRRLDSEH